MVLTNYRKFMVEKYYSFEPLISKEEFCKNHSRTTIRVKDFEKWIVLYQDSLNSSIIPEKKIRIKKQIDNAFKVPVKAKTSPKPPIDMEKVKKERNHKTHLRQIRYFKSVVKTGKFSFSKDERKQTSRIKMFLESENTFKIYKLALILAEDLNNTEYKVDLLLKELKKNNINLPKDFFNFQFTNKNSLPLESFTEESSIELSPVVFEIDPLKNNKIILQNDIKEKEELNSLCENSISNLQATLAGVYKILEGLQS